MRKVHILDQDAKYNETNKDADRHKKREQYNQRARNHLKKAVDLRLKQKLVQDHLNYFITLEKTLKNLDNQTNQITEGDIQALKKKSNLYTFNPQREN